MSTVTQLPVRWPFQVIPHFTQSAPAVPNQTAHPVKRERRGRIGLPHQLQRHGVLEVPVQPVTAIHCEPCPEQHEWPVPPLTFDHDVHGP